MNISWNFPNNGCGQIRGISDAGIEMFKDNKMRSLTREICQNSLDASIDSKKPVKVVFESYIVNTESIPGIVEYKKAIENALEYWTQKNNSKAIDYLSNAKRSIEKAKTLVLRISDYNTTGLLDVNGIGSNGWNAVTKLDGGSTKEGDSAGSYGIGKNASFCCSDYRLVFYRTINKDNEKAAQGVSRFVSFPEDMNDIEKTMTYGIGYYGNTYNNTPVESIINLDIINNRTEIGTDIFIYGFNADKNWKNDIKLELLNNFLMSIYKGNLEVCIDKEIINKNTIESIIKAYEIDLKDVSSYYMVLTDKETEAFTMDFHGMGTLKLSVLTNPRMSLNRKVLITRKSGMKLFDKKNISRHISFSAILEMQGKTLNEYFREMENPSHNEWDLDRAKNKKEASALKKDLFEWIKETILKKGEFLVGEEIELDGLGNILQKSGKIVDNGISIKNLDRSPSDVASGNNSENSIFNSEEYNEEDKVENKNPFKEKNRVIKILEPPKKKNKYSLVIEKVNLNEIGNDDNKTEDLEGHVSSDGEHKTTRTLKGDRKRRRKESHLGNESEGGDDVVHKNVGKKEKATIDNIKVIKINRDAYRVIFNLDGEIKKSYATISTIGENGKPNYLSIKDAVGIKGCSDLKVNKNRILFPKINGEGKVIFEFKLFEDRVFAMEVKIYEY